MIHDRWDENVSLDELARQARLSRFSLIRAFRRHVGMPPHAYQLRVRIHRCRSLLVAGLPLAQIASLGGFADQSHFTKTFKKVLGVTPGRYLEERQRAA
jgi:transcriptional regulator GlxA family with amidase domain